MSTHNLCFRREIRKIPPLICSFAGLILILELKTFILSMKFHFYTCSRDHPFVSKAVIWVNIA